jgi:hypothetical protein
MADRGCSWLTYAETGDRYPYPLPLDSHECGRPPIVVYWKPNPRAIEPDQPNILAYPRCEIHDTEDSRLIAPKQGFTVEVLA